MNQLEIEAVLNELLIKAESDLEKVFARRLRTILFSVSEMYRKYEKDGELSFTDLNKHNRFQKEMKMIADALSEDYSHIIKQMQATFEQQYIAKYLMMAYLLEMALSDDEEDEGFSLSALALPIKNILLAAIKKLALPLLLGSYRKATAQKVGAEIVKGISDGESYTVIAKRIEKILIAEKGKEAPSLSEIVKMLQNPSAKLVLPKEMEQHRDNIVKQLNIEIAQGLAEGQDSPAIAEQIVTQINSKPIKDGTDMGFDIPSLPTIKEALRNPIEFLTLPKIMEQHRNDIVRKINIEIAQGLIAGEGYATIAKRIEKQVGFASKKARLVARTEAGRSRSIAAEKVREEASKHAKLTPVWASMLDHRVRMTHRKLDGQEADKDGLFHHKSNKTKAPRLWVGPDSAALSIQCRCVLIMKVNGKLPEYRRERDYMDDKYQQKLADKIDEHMADSSTYVQALKKAQKEVTPPSRVIPYVSYDEWLKERTGEQERLDSSGEYGVNFDYVRSKAYREKVASDPQIGHIADRIVNASRKMLQHRNGTPFEDYYLLDKHEGKIVALSNKSREIKGVVYNKKVRDAFKSGKPGSYVSIHNHPSGYPPSLSDIAALDSKSKHNTVGLGIVAGHDGSMYWYTTAEKKFNKNDNVVYGGIVAKFVRLGYNEVKAQELALEEMSIRHGFKFGRVGDGDG